MTRALLRLPTWGLAAAVAVSCTACGDDADPDFDGVSVTVGSRDFTEQYVLSAILIEALDEFGAEVVDATATGDLATTRDALENGEIDAYFEYNSTALVEVFGEPPSPGTDGEELTDEARDLDAANDIHWLGRSTFSNTYGFALNERLGADHEPSRYSVGAFDLDDLALLLEFDDERVVCVEPDFVRRADGLTLFEAHTGYEIPADQLRVVDSSSEIYGLLDELDCDVGEVFTTDGELVDLGLLLVEDPGVFLVYNASLTIRDDAYQQAPDAFDEVVEAILAALTQERMSELNGRAASGEPVADIAEEFVEQFLE